MKYIEALYQEFNRKYFRNRLPEIVITYARGHVQNWAYFEEDKSLRIVLSPLLKDYQLAMEGILLHEMIHAFLCVKYKKAGYIDHDSYLWLEHTREFKDMEKVFNIRHFGNPRGHTHYFNLMMDDLDK